MKALIIEDETAAAVNLQAILREIAPDVEVLATIETVEESVAWLREREQPDLLFMDIHLADGESFRIFDRVEVNVPVVFTTAYDRYALEAFRVNSIDYLLKPINPADLQRALQKLARLSGGERAAYPERVRTMNAARRERVFLVHVRDKIVPLDRDRIAFFYTANERVTACTFQGEEYPLDRTLESLQAVLPTTTFSVPTASSSSHALPCGRSRCGSAAVFRSRSRCRRPSGSSSRRLAYPNSSSGFGRFSPPSRRFVPAN